MVTLGSEGFIVYDRHSKQLIKYPSLGKEIFDVTGAGDTFAAALFAAYLSGSNLEHASLFANQAAGIAVSRLGTTAVTLNDIIHCVNPIPGRLVVASNISQTCKILHMRGRKIVFTNGCFDLLHAGHVSLLEKAKRYGDFLIVGVNSDKSVRHLKGKGRPVIPQAQRISLLASLACVDMVTVFEGNSPLKLIKAIAPHILCKGNDYKSKKVIGQEWIEKRGGKVVLIPIDQKFSTSRIVKKIQHVPK